MNRRPSRDRRFFHARKEAFKLTNLSREDRLIEVRDALREAIEECTSTRDLPGLSREYRAVIAELDTLQAPDDFDAIDDIIRQINESDAASAPVPATEGSDALD